MSRRLAALSALAAVALSGAALPAEAAPAYRTATLSVAVDGSSVTAETVVKARRSTKVRQYGICVRDAGGREVDFPGKKSGVVLRSKGTAYAATATFSPGTYTYYPCLQTTKRRWVGLDRATFVVPPTTSETPSGPVEAPPSAPADVAWPAPALTDPVHVAVTQAKHNLKLDRARDYVLHLPPTALDVGTGNLSINGGRRVVLVGGEITGTGERGTIRATNQAEYLHVEGVRISGAHLQEGIQLQDEDNAVVQLENIKIDQVSGSYSGHHADLVQTWGGGPKALRIDRLSGSTDYQAFMLQGGGSTDRWDFRHVNITHVGSAGWTMFDADPRSAGMAFTDVWFDGNEKNGIYSLGHSRGRDGLTYGKPAQGDFASTTAGLAYRS